MVTELSARSRFVFASVEMEVSCVVRVALLVANSLSTCIISKLKPV